VWAREGLDRRTRSAITLAVLTALGRENEIAMHVRAARTNGLTPEEISEVLLHTAVYAGIPAGVEAFAAAAEVLKAISRSSFDLDAVLQTVVGLLVFLAYSTTPAVARAIGQGQGAHRWGGLSQRPRTP